ncbi:MAG TPA: protein kinase family protein [Ornithinibacter sp.]|nr:protein kinase family protein [Ornithinibacter sp.]
MRGVGPGTVLGGRYTVHQRLEERHDTERWSADDTTLGRRVSVLCIATDDHRTPALLDAARRAGSLTHPVFVRILDVGHDDEVAYVVEEELDEARDLGHLVSEGGVPGDEVRRITGEVAAALESARHRGMHHLDLRPEDVVRTPEGDIRLRGLETAAVRIGEDGTEAEDAGRRDAIGVVALAYAGLTGLWPLATGGSGLGPAPRVPGGVAAPSEIAAGVPRDLDALCRLTLNDDQGPTNPGDFARQVAPWPSRQVIGRPVTRSVAAQAPAPPEAGPEAGPAEPEAGPGGASATATVALPVTTALAAAGGARTLAEPAAATAASDARASSDAAWASLTDLHEDQVGTTRGHADHLNVTSEVAQRDTAGSTITDDPYGDELDDEAVGADVSRRPTSAAAGAAVAGAGAAMAGAIGTVGGRVGGMARRAVDKVSELSPDTAPRTSSDGLEAPAPLVPAEPLSKDESKLALGIVAGFLILALVIGVWGVSRIGSSTRDFFGDDIAAPVPSASTATPSPSVSGSTPAESGGPPEPLAILKVEAYDPEGDGEENNKLTPKVYDGDVTTGWFSENYRSEQFGGLKEGLGVIVDLGPNKKPQTVELVIPVATSVEVYVGPDNRREGATKIGEKAEAQGTVKFDVPADVSGQYIVVWFTGLTSDDDGKRRAWLNEVVVTG